MKRKYMALAVLLLTAFLPACSADTAAQLSELPAAASSFNEAVGPSQTTTWETVVDEQGAVSVAVTPVDLSGDTLTLEFEVVLDTHSVDLSMDLAVLATVSTDTGRSVTAMNWDAVPGGHHLSGVLSFPGEADGMAFLEGASRLILTIRDVDAPERVFTWNLAN